MKFEMFSVFVSLGTSGSRTPDDDLDTSHFGAPRRIGSPRSSNENLVDDDKVSVTRDSLDCVISRSSSSYSVAPSFSSDFPDTESLLPDLSDTVGSGKLNSSVSVGLPVKDMRISEVQSESRIRSYSGNTGARPRPRTLGLLKRNSDLPGRVQRADDFNTGFFPLGMKSSNSDTNLNKDPYAIEEEVSLAAMSEAVNSYVNTLECSLKEEKDKVDDEKQTSSPSKPEIVTHVDIDAMPAPVEGGVSQEVVASEVMTGSVHSPTKERSKHDLSSPNKVPPPPPPVAKKPPRSPSVEKKDFEPSEKHSAEETSSVPEVPLEVGSRELIIPVMTALQERRPSTPNCSTAQASTDTQVPDRLQSPGDSAGEEKKVSGSDEKKTEAKTSTRSAYTTRVSVKDRLQQYERSRSASADSGRKLSTDPFNPTSVASRKQLFEQKERGMHKRVTDVGVRKPRSDSGSGSGSASGSPKLSRKRLNDGEDGSSAVGITSPASGSPKLPRKRLDESVDASSAIAASTSVQISPEKTKPVEQEKLDELRRRHRKERSEKTDRPRSLVLDDLSQVDSLESTRPRSGDYDSLKLDLHNGERDTLSPREIDIPLDEGFNEGHKSERTRRSPNTSPRNSRANVRFPDDSKEEDREPQFV